MSDHPIPRVAVAGIAGGLLLMSFFTVLWASWIFPGFPFPIALPIALVFSSLAVLFLVEGIRLLAVLRRFPTLPTEDRKGRTRRMGLQFGAIFGTEGVLIGVASGILGATGNTDYLAPVIALIVGVHFIPMARLFRRTIDYYVAAWVVLWAIAGIVALALRDAPAGPTTSLVAITTAIGTSVYGLYMLREKRSVLARARRSISA